MSNLCFECGQYAAEGCRQWCPVRDPQQPARKQKPRARSTDPATSLEAAKTVSNVGKTQQRILCALRAHGPMTDEELCKAIADQEKEPVSVSGIRTRRSELVELGDVYDTGKTRLTVTGRSAIVWGER